MWVLLQSFPAFFIGIFSDDLEVIKAGVPVLRLFYGAFFIMSLQYAGQSTFLALGKSHWATFFSIFRKVVLIIPLALLLPRFWGLGSAGVFLAEPISEFIGGGACFITMLMTVWQELKED
jgi:Na+-driven multidrug efflux pump